MNKISLIVPVYNCEEYLEDCFQSILHQTIDKELMDVIIINDGSVDGSLDIIKKYVEQYDNWYLIDQENAGLSCARNAALDMNKNCYVVFLDSDDELPYDAISKLYNKIESTNGDIVIGGMENYNSMGHYDNYTKKHLMNIDDIDYGKYSYLFDFVHAPSKIYRNSIIKDLRFIKGVKHEDTYFTYSVYLRSKKIYMIDDIVYFHRIREGENKSITQSLDIHSFKDLLVNYQHIFDENEINYLVSSIMYKKVVNYIARRLKRNEKKDALLELDRFYHYIILRTKFSLLERVLFYLKKIYYKVAIYVYGIIH